MPSAPDGQTSLIGQEKCETMRWVEAPGLSARRTINHLDIHRSVFYNWMHRYQDNGIPGSV